MNKTQILIKAFGGEWKYDGTSTWHKNNDKIYVSRCSQLFDDEGKSPPEYWLYCDGVYPQKIDWYELMKEDDFDVATHDHK